METMIEIGPAKNLREDILGLEKVISGMPGAVFGDSDLLPLKHSFAEGIYVREIFIPKGFVLTGKIHRHSHPNFLMKGEVIVVTEQGGRQRLKAPLSMISAPGTKRAILALEDTVWVTVHFNPDDTTDLAKIEEYVIAKTYDDLLLPGGNPMLESELAMKNCLILALKEKGRGYQCLLGLKAEGTLLPFKESIEKLKQGGISTDGLFAVKQTDGSWHVALENGTPLDEVAISDSEWVGTWAGTAVAVYAGSTAYSAYQASQGGDDAPGPPPMTEEEVQANKEYQNLLFESRSKQQALRPLLEKQFELKPTYGDDPRQVKLFKELQDLRVARGGGTGEGYNDADTQALVKKITDLGYSGSGGPTQVITGYERTPAGLETDKRVAELQKLGDEATKRQFGLYSLRADRQEKALRGELPVSAGTTQRKLEEFQVLKENMSRSGNPIIGETPETAYSLTTSGDQSLSTFKKRYGYLEDLERRGEIDSGSAALATSLGLATGIGSQRYATSVSSGPAGIPGQALTSGFADFGGGYLAGQQPYQAQRGLQYQASEQNAANRAARNAGWAQLAGQSGSSALMALLLRGKGGGGGGGKTSPKGPYEMDYNSGDYG